MKGKLSIKQKQAIQWGGIGIVILSAILLTTTSSPFVNDALMKVNDDEIFVVGTDFENQPDGDLVNEGTMVFSGDIHSVGIVGCGSCNTGVNYIRNELGDLQTISGDGMVEMHDVILENEEGIDLELELHVVNSLNFNNSQIRTNRDLGEEVFVHFKENAISVNPGPIHHVDGYVAKSGEGKFVLPTGDGSRFLPVGIEGASSDSKFKAAYYNTDPNEGAPYPGGPFYTLDYDIFDLTYVSKAGFWHIEGNSASKITLSWDQTSNIGSWAPSIDSVVVVAWNGSEWVSLGHEEGKGDLNQGLVTSRSVIPDEYKVFALGKSTTAEGPVDFLTFDAVQKGDDGYLFWTTVKEVDNFYFDVERSLDAIIFEKFGLVQAVGNSDTSNYYDYWDEGVALRDLDRIFYRIRQVDLDGTFIYTHIEELVFGDDEGDEIDLVIYPNPVVDVVTIRYVAREALQAKLKIFNMLGQIVYQDPTALIGAGELTIDLTKIAIGHYVLVLGNEEVQATKKLVITH